MKKLSKRSFILKILLFIQAMLGLYINSYTLAANSFLAYPWDQKEIVLSFFPSFFLQAPFEEGV